MSDHITMEKVHQLTPSEVHVGWRVRQDLGDLQNLVSAIGEVGQLQPIVVRWDEEKKRYELIAGLRRLYACDKLQRDVKAVVVEPKDELHELDMQLQENMARKQFDLLETGAGLKRRLELYQQVHPETKSGASGKGRPKAPSNGGKPAKRFTLVASDRFRMSESKVAELIQIANLPKSKRRQVEEAKTTSERNRVAQQMLREVRLENKKKKLAEEAKKQQEQRQLVESAEPIHLSHMDCMDYMKACKEGSFHLCLTDPEYELEPSVIAHTSRADIGGKQKWDKLEMAWVAEAARILTDDGQLLAFCKVEDVGFYKLVLEAAGLTYKQHLIWHKSNPGTVYREKNYMPSDEAVVWAVKGPRYFFATWEEQAGAVAHNVIPGPICQGRDRLHPTQKPLWIMKRLLQRHAVSKLTRVIDPFAGSGTTLVACKEMQISAAGVEENAEYVKIARNRLEAMG